jgi:hypothetical protein
LPPEEDRYSVSSERAKNVLGINFRSLEETFTDLGAQLLELEKQSKS